MPDEHSRNRVCRLQNAAMLFIHVLAYAVIYLRTEEEDADVFRSPVSVFPALSGLLQDVLPQFIKTASE